MKYTYTESKINKPDLSEMESAWWIRSSAVYFDEKHQEAGIASTGVLELDTFYVRFKMGVSPFFVI